jgi:hypothetical protein
MKSRSDRSGAAPSTHLVLDNLACPAGDSPRWIPSTLLLHVALGLAR